MSFRDLFTELGKAAPAAVIGFLQWLTNAIPTLLLWMTFVYTGLQMYVFIRDKVRRRQKD